MGNRVLKKVIPKSGTATTMLYIRDASGNEISMYTLKTDSTHWNSANIYGSSRVGMYEPNKLIGKFGVKVTNSNNISTLTRGLRLYELSNHLGNVLAVISDKRTTVCNGVLINYYEADIVYSTDYHAFGSSMAGRNFSNSSYKYGWNGKETEKEIFEGCITFEARIYNSHLGRFLSTDPREEEYPWQSTYVYFSNSPISILDVNGEGSGTKTHKVQSGDNLTSIAKGALGASASSKQVAAYVEKLRIANPQTQKRGQRDQVNVGEVLNLPAANAETASAANKTVVHTKIPNNTENNNTKKIIQAVTAAVVSGLKLKTAQIAFNSVAVPVALGEPTPGGEIVVGLINWGFFAYNATTTVIAIYKSKELHSLLSKSYQGKYDHELSPLTDIELEAKKADAKANKDTKTLEKIKTEEKRRETRRRGNQDSKLKKKK